MRMLIADDEIVSRIKVQTILSEVGVCNAAADGSEAVAAFVLAHEEGNPYDLITMDIEMPNMDGVEALKKIRKWEHSHDIKFGNGVRVLMLTASESPASVLSSFKEGSVAYVVKPIAEAKLVAALKDFGFPEFC